MADVEKKEAPPGEVKESQGVEDREKQVSKMAAEMTGIPDGKAPSKQGSKEGIRSPQARQMEAAQYKPLIIEVKNNLARAAPQNVVAQKSASSLLAVVTHLRIL
eukprot:CAMPEP_0206393566 /NCGR_PEP_ID=MMETSP0294-20121207/20802_1 /ASSEMBLY_ACC=CAM_ASM_000327 /TAXON_ID=39354 /ORGANISM="Heterosigma akashiwo, Strain CCMP2393" /LENGTH=103 /DNA_ID=CAMNT_0053847203 /DNA_START=127 /DNA_END=439 /DNA_ORIENTATION=+